MKTEREIVDLIRAIYKDVGGAPADLAHIRPLYGGWLNALRYEVVRMDKASTLLWRVDIEKMNRRPLTKALRALVPDSRRKGISPVPHARYQQDWRRFSRSRVVPATHKPASAAEPAVASVQPDGDGVVERHASRLRPSTTLLVLCGSCFAQRPHVVTLLEQSANAVVVVVARCHVCHATIEVVATGGSQPRRTIATRLKKAINLSAAHRAALPINAPPIAGEGLQGTRVSRARNGGP